MQLFGALPIKGFSIGILAAFLAVAAPLIRGAPWPFIIPSSITLLAAYLAAAQPWRAGGKSGKLSTRRGGRSGRKNGSSKKNNRKRSHLRVVRDDDGPMLN